MSTNHHYNNWADYEDKMLLQAKKEGKSFYKIANEFGMSTKSVKQRWHKIKPKTTT